jgi:hypothetical protein
MVTPSPMGGFLKSIFMTKQERAEFLSKPPEGNVTRVAQQIAKLNSDRRYQIAVGLKRLNEVLGCSKELTLKELLEAIEIIK